MTVSANPARPAASVVLLRDGPDGPQVLLCHRAAALRFAGGFWVFPGGRVEPADSGGEPAGEVTLENARARDAARRAAVREVREEVGLTVRADDLVPMALWVPPESVPHRYATWYFVTATTGEGSPRPDGREIDEFLWVTPRDAIRARDERRLALMSPTWLTLFRLRDFATAAEAVDAIRGQTPSLFETRVVATTGGRVALWAGDAGYVTQRLDVAGARNRLWMLDSGWRYEQTA